MLSAWRWQRVLAVFDAHTRLPNLVSHYLAGQFVGNFLPSTIGGDVLRVSRLTQLVHGAGHLGLRLGGDRAADRAGSSCRSSRWPGSC